MVKRQNTVVRFAKKGVSKVLFSRLDRKVDLWSRKKAIYGPGALKNFPGEHLVGNMLFRKCLNKCWWLSQKVRANELT